MSFGSTWWWASCISPPVSLLLNKINIMFGIGEAPKNTINASSHPSYWAFTLIALIIPLAGFILGIIYLCHKEELDRKLGFHTLFSAIFFQFGWFIFLIIL